jgi:hypothetical protein
VSQHDVFLVVVSVIATLFVIRVTTAPPLVAVFSVQIRPHDNESDPFLGRLTPPEYAFYKAQTIVPLQGIDVHLYRHHVQFQVRHDPADQQVKSALEFVFTQPNYVLTLWQVYVDENKETGLKRIDGQPRLVAQFDPGRRCIVVGLVDGRFASGPNGAPRNENVFATIPLSAKALRKLRTDPVTSARPWERWDFIATRKDAGFTWFAECKDVAGKFTRLRFW